MTNPTTAAASMLYCVPAATISCCSYCSLQLQKKTETQKRCTHDSSIKRGNTNGAIVECTHPY